MATSSSDLERRDVAAPHSDRPRAARRSLFGARANVPSEFPNVLRRLESVAVTVQRRLLPLILACWATGYATWALTYPLQLPRMLDNSLTHAERLVCLSFVAMALVLGL